MKPADIELLGNFSSPVVIGEQTFVVASRADLDSNSYTSQVFSVKEAELRRMSHGWSDTKLQYRGNTFGLIRGEADKPGQLFAGPHPGAVSQYTNFPLGVSDYALGHDGKTALVIARVPETGRYGTDEKITAAAEAARRIAKARYLANGVGYVLDRPARAFLVELPERGYELSGVLGAAAAEVPEELPGPAGDLSDPQVRPDGAGSFIGSLADAPVQRVSLLNTVWVVCDGVAKPVNLGAVAVNTHRWIDNDTLLFTAIDLSESETDFVAQIPGLYTHRLATGVTRRISSLTELEFNSAHLEVVGDTVYATVSYWGAERLIRFGLKTVMDAQPCLDVAAVEFVSAADHVVTGVGHGNGRTVVAYASPDTSAALAQYDNDGNAEIVAEISAMTQTHFARPHEVRVTGSGGEIQGWVAIPDGDGPFPVVVNIHGGPFAGYTHAFFDETQVLTGSGYAVVYSNPRGSYGRGREWGKAVQEDMAEPAAADVLAVLEYALDNFAQLDKQRIGIQGGSYGGYLTAMLIGSDHRFAGAIVERGYLNPDSFVGTSDIGGFFSEEYTGTNPEHVWRQSPMRAAETTRCPTLVIHSELDFRCPLEQAQQYFAKLQRYGVNTEMLIFPGENHELSRSGQPRHRLERFEAILEWWAEIFGTGLAMETSNH